MRGSIAAEQAQGKRGRRTLMLASHCRAAILVTAAPTGTSPPPRMPRRQLQPVPGLNLKVAIDELARELPGADVEHHRAAVAQIADEASAPARELRGGSPHVELAAFRA